MVPCPSPPAKVSKTPIRTTLLSTAFCGAQSSSIADELEHICWRNDSELIKEWVTQRRHFGLCFVYISPLWCSGWPLFPYPGLNNDVPEALPLLYPKWPLPTYLGLCPPAVPWEAPVSIPWAVWWCTRGHPPFYPGWPLSPYLGLYDDVPAGPLLFHTGWPLDCVILILPVQGPAAQHWNYN